jgi:hypothetical protein
MYSDMFPAAAIAFKFVGATWPFEVPGCNGLRASGIARDALRWASSQRKEFITIFETFALRSAK